MRGLALFLLGLLALKAPGLIEGVLQAAVWTLTDPAGTAVIIAALGVTLTISAVRHRPQYARRWA
jgi:hypothetical protein